MGEGDNRVESPSAVLRQREPAQERWLSIGRDVQVYRGEGVWAVMHMADVVYRFPVGDVGSMRVCMAQLSLQKLATEEELAEAFGCSRVTVCRAKSAFLKGGTPAVVPKRRGPKGSRLAASLVGQIARLRREGLGYRSIGRELLVPRSTVVGVCKRLGLRGRDGQARLSFEAGPGAWGEPAEGPVAVGEAGGCGESCETPAAGAPQAPPPPDTQEAVPGEVEPLRPVAEVGPGEPAPARTVERALAHAGILGRAEVAPEFVSGSEVPAAGVLLAVAMVGKDGCLEVARGAYGALANGFYGLRSLVLTLLTAAWLGVRSVDSLQHGRPHLWGRLLGLDRLPETKTVARKFHEIAARKLGREFMSRMAERRIQANRTVCGVLYVDGHVRQYHGRRRVSRHFVTRRHLAAPAIEDWWVHDGACEPLLRIPGRPGRSMVAMVREIAADARRWVGPDRPLTVVFDRGGWSPKLFAELAREGVYILTYRKGKRRPYPLADFDQEIPLPDRAGRTSRTYRTRDRRTNVSGHRFRSVTVLGKREGHQTEILTTDPQTPTAGILREMFTRWGQENYFKYERTHRSLDLLGSYRFEPVPDDAVVPNPAHQELGRRVREARTRLRTLEVAPDKPRRPGQVGWWTRRLARLKALRRATPRRIRVGDLPEAERPEEPDPERKLFCDVLTTSAQRIETRLLGLLARHYKSSYKDGRQLLRQILHDTGDLALDGNVLTVTLNPLASPHQTAALAALSTELNATAPQFPEAGIHLRFQVHEHP
jgi:hypothetical protein